MPAAVKHPSTAGNAPTGSPDVIAEWPARWTGQDMGAFLVNDQEQVSIDISSAQIDRPQRNPAQGRTQLWFGMTAFCAAGVVAAGVLLGGGSRVLPSPSELTRAPGLRPWCKP